MKGEGGIIQKSGKCPNSYDLHCLKVEIGKNYQKSCIILWNVVFILKGICRMYPKIFGLSVSLNNMGVLGPSHNSV